MGIFDRNQGGRGWHGGPGGQEGRGWADRAAGAARRGWNQVRDTFDHDDHDRGGHYGAQGNRGFGGGWQGGNRDFGGNFGGGRDFGGQGGYAGGGWRGRSDVYGEEPGMTGRGRDLPYRGDTHRDLPYRGDVHRDLEHGLPHNRGWGAGGQGGYDHEWNDRGQGGGGVGGRFLRGWQGVEHGLRGREGRGDYDRDFGGWQGGERGGAELRYDRDYGAGGRGFEGGWDRDRGQPRSQTDTGDPFGDRQARTPIRVMRGGGRETGGRGFGGGGGSFDRYDEAYRGYNQGIGDEPYYNADQFRGASDYGEFGGRGELNRGADRPYYRDDRNDWF